jgi:uncharacterized protein involved in exopolysaccharide biosynthesis
MDSDDRANFNATGPFAPPPSPLPDTGPLRSRARFTGKRAQDRSLGVLSRLANRWQQIVLLWLLVSAALIVLIYLNIPPTYEATSRLLIEPTQPELFSPLKTGTGDGRDLAYLNTQIGLIKRAQVLAPVIADPMVANLSSIKKLNTPIEKLCEKLRVAIVDDTYLVRISLEWPNLDDALTIVQSVDQSFITQSVDASQPAKRWGPAFATHPNNLID